MDLYTKLVDMAPQQIKGLELINEHKHAPSILGLLQLPAFSHWTLLDALNFVVLVDLKWRDPLTQPRNMPKAEITALVDPDVPSTQATACPARHNVHVHAV